MMLRLRCNIIQIRQALNEKMVLAGTLIPLFIPHNIFTKNTSGKVRIQTQKSLDFKRSLQYTEVEEGD